MSLTTRDKVVGGSAIAIALIAILFGRGSNQAEQIKSSEWRVSGSFENDDMFKFVTVTPGSEKNRRVYDDAAAKLCESATSPRICILHFFAQGDRIPSKQPKGQFFRSGGFSDYRQLAVYWRNQNSGVAEFTDWDCERAGIEGSPLSALCDPVVKETYSAALGLGSRTSNILGCGWPQTDDAAHFASFLLTVTDLEKRELYRRGFDTMNSGKGPDDRANCINLRANIEARAKAARQTLGIPQPMNSQPAVQPTTTPRRVTRP